jgi:hypothetical protein
MSLDSTKMLTAEEIDEKLLKMQSSVKNLQSRKKILIHNTSVPIEVFIIKLSYINKELKVLQKGLAELKPNYGNLGSAPEGYNTTRY